MPTLEVAWRQRGYNDAVGKRGSHPPKTDDEAVIRAYLAGYRSGERTLRDREEGRL